MKWTTIKNCISELSGWDETREDFKTLFETKHGRNECVLWILINGLVCQMPLIFMYINDIPGSAIFSSGLSYLFTLYIASLYMLISIREKNKLTMFDLKNRRFVFSLILIIVTFGLLCIYPDIKRDCVRDVLVEHSFGSYIVVMIFSLLAAFLISCPSLIQKIKENNQEKEVEEKIKTYRKTEKEVDDFKQQMIDQGESFE